MMHYSIRKYVALVMMALIAFTPIAQAGPFVSGQVLTASQLNSVVDTKTDNAAAAITAGTITGVVINNSTIGATTPSVGKFTYLQTNNLLGGAYGFSASSYDASATGTGIQLIGARGTSAVPSATLSGDTLGNVDFYGYGTAYIEGSFINAIAGSTWTGSNAETHLAFGTTPSTSVIAAERMRVASNGALLVGTTVVPSATTTGSTTFATTATGDVLVANGGMLSLATESAGNYNFTGLGYSTANTNNASIGLKSQTRGAAAALDGDTLGVVDVFGWQGTAYNYAAAIDILADGNWGPAASGSKIQFWLTPNAGNTNTLAATFTTLGATLPGLVGTITNNNATAGNVGEYVTSTVGAAVVPLTTAVSANMTSISLTAGDWDVSGVCGMTTAATTSVTMSVCGISTTTATLGAGGTYSRNTMAAVVPGATEYVDLATPVVRLSLAATTTVYLIGQSTFTVSTQSAGGTIRARRVR